MLDRRRAALASGTWLPRAARAAPTSACTDSRRRGRSTRRDLARPPDAAVLRLHPLPGRLPDDARDAARRCSRQAAAAAGLRVRVRHASIRSATRPRRSRSYLDAFDPQFHRRAPASAPRSPPLLQQLRRVAVNRVELPGGGLHHGSLRDALPARCRRAPRRGVHAAVHVAALAPTCARAADLARHAADGDAPDPAPRRARLRRAAVPAAAAPAVARCVHALDAQPRARWLQERR